MKLVPVRSITNMRGMIDHALASSMRSPPRQHTYIIYPRATG